MAGDDGSGWKASCLDCCTMFHSSCICATTACALVAVAAAFLFPFACFFRGVDARPSVDVFVKLALMMLRVDGTGSTSWGFVRKSLTKLSTSDPPRAFPESILLRGEVQSHTTSL